MPTRKHKQLSRVSRRRSRSRRTSSQYTTRPHDSRRSTAALWRTRSSSHARRVRRRRPLVQTQTGGDVHIPSSIASVVDTDVTTASGDPTDDADSTAEADASSDTSNAKEDASDADKAKEDASDTSNAKEEDASDADKAKADAKVDADKTDKTDKTDNADKADAATSKTVTKLRQQNKELTDLVQKKTHKLEMKEKKVNALERKLLAHENVLSQIQTLARGNVLSQIQTLVASTKKTSKPGENDASKTNSNTTTMKDFFGGIF